MRGFAVYLTLTDGLEQAAQENVEKAVDDVQKQVGLIGRHLATLPDTLFMLAIHAVLALLLFVLGSRAIALIRRLVRRALERSDASRDAGQFLDSAIKVVLHVILVFLILQIFGLEAASIATVIGSVGVTIGLAIQGSLSNCIGGILILTLKPFKVGDYIVEDTYHNEGIVQQISVFYTKLATYDNRIILIPNGTLANAGMINVTDEAVRRVDFTIGISYDSDIRKARQVVEQLAKEHPLVLKDREISVFVDSFADSSVVLGVRFWTKREDFWQARCEMMENVKYGFDAADIRIPFPQMDVHLER